MSAPIPIEALEVIGYATKLTDSMVPTVVTPVFRVKADPERVVLPPFRLYQGQVYDAALCDRSEFDAHAHRGDVTQLDSPIPTQACFELWVDENMTPLYEDQEDVDDKLSLIARQSLEKARKALSGGNLDEAESLTSTAISADDRYFEPLAVKAAIRRQQGREGGVRVMARLAEGLCSRECFETLVDCLCKDMADTLRGESGKSLESILGDDATRSAATLPTKIGMFDAATYKACDILLQTGP